MAASAQVAVPTWCRFYGEVPANLIYPRISLSDALRGTADRLPGAVALEFLGSTMTYRELGRGIDRTAAAFAALGLRAGDRLLIVMPTTPQAVLAYYAANALGAVAVLVHPLSTAAGIEEYARAAGARMALALDVLYGRCRPALDTGAFDTLVLTRIGDPLRPFRRLALRFARRHRSPRVPSDPRVHWWAELMRRRHPPAPRAVRDPSSPSTVLFSGGTMGSPKGVLLSDRNLLCQGLQLARWVGIREGDRVLAALPLFHGFGLSTLVNAPLLTGARVILVPEFTPEVVARVIRRSRPNLIAGVPSIYSALARQRSLEGADLSCIRVAFSGGDTLPGPVRERFDQLLRRGGSPARLLEGYGLTENVSAAIVMPLREARAGSIGVPLPDTLVSIRDPESGQELLVGQAGEICIAGPAVMLGYLNDPAASAAALRCHEDGRVWLHTGDIGRQDEDGFFYFVGRRKRMIKTSGFNVFPGEVERVLCDHPALAEAYVMGVPDDSRGELVRAYVIPRDPDAVPNRLTAQLHEHCRERLNRWSCPREIEIRREFPRNRVGKVDERALLNTATDTGRASA